MIPINKCKDCEYFIGQVSCLAFPKRIPNKIWFGENNHSKNVSGDHGLVFKKKGSVKNERNT